MLLFLILALSVALAGECSADWSGIAAEMRKVVGDTKNRGRCKVL